ncbi:MAG: hypothetical protein JSW34_05050 [Candidatus Zixiibacteriota bacterium]|nr:MAG: hypothetical protein JSW34_05050 [candidate division Zixibacteria bacterium]
MRNKIIFLLAVVLLFLIPSFILQAVYGPSYGFLAGEDCWVPDGQGGWQKHGDPATPPPAQPSVEVPMAVRYIPIFLPGLLLILFLFTPLTRHLETRSKEPPPEPPDDTAAPTGPFRE